MQGNIDFIGSLSGSIAGGGGSGSDVTITPTYSSGTKLADYTIDETSGAIFVDLSNYPTNEEIASNHFTKAEINTMMLNDRQYEDLTFQRRDEMSNFQPKLTAGENISIDENNVISASGGNSSWDYSTSEVDTGQKWTDNKDLFIKTFHGQLTISTTNRTWYDLISNLSYMDKVFVMPESYIELSDAIINIPYTSYFNNVGAVVGANFDTPTHTFQLLIGGLPTGTYDYEITLKYTKTSV